MFMGSTQFWLGFLGSSGILLVTFFGTHCTENNWNPKLSLDKLTYKVGENECNILMCWVDILFWTSEDLSSPWHSLVEICLIDEPQRGKLERGEDSQVTCVNSHRATSDLNDADFFLKESNIILSYFMMSRMQRMYYGLSFFHSGLISRKILL